MSGIILARLSASLDQAADRRVHMFGTHQDKHDGTRKAFCGFTAHHSVLELVSVIGGMGCELCIRDIPDDVLSIGSGANDPWPPEDDASSTKTYAIGLRGEQKWHWVPERPLLSCYEQRTVVLTEYGVIGFLPHGELPPGWRACRKCNPELREVPMTAHLSRQPDREPDQTAWSAARSRWRVSGERETVTSVSTAQRPT